MLFKQLVFMGKSNDTLLVSNKKCSSSLANHFTLPDKRLTKQNNKIIIEPFLEKDYNEIKLKFYGSIIEPMYILEDIKKILGISDITLRFTSGIDINKFSEDTKMMYTSDNVNPQKMITGNCLQRVLSCIKTAKSQHLKTFIYETLELHSNSTKTIIRNIPKTEGFNKSLNGIIYINEDTDKPGHIKIGLTTGTCEKRLAQLNCGSSTNSIINLKTYNTSDVYRAETIIHRIMKPYRIINQTEWFYIPNNQLKEKLYTVVENCIEFLDLFGNDPLGN